MAPFFGSFFGQAKNEQILKMIFDKNPVALHIEKMSCSEETR
jgi:hypothetical protein